VERAVVMTGLGGQGVQLLAKLLTHAAIREGRHVLMFGLFMGMIRGGSSESTVVVADGEVTMPPIVPSVWGVLALHGQGLAALAPKIERGGVLVANTSLVAEPPAWDGVRLVGVPATALAKTMGVPLGAGMIALGAFAAATGLVRVEALQAAVDDVLPPHRRQLAEANRACLAHGASAVSGAAGAAAAREP
jgi:Pyruvate/2-oxoacid:ferredoxin oxidoreductase gamma subunit